MRSFEEFVQWVGKGIFCVVTSVESKLVIIITEFLFTNVMSEIE